MAGAIDNPTETFLKYLNEGGQYPEGDGSWPSAGPEQADVDLSNLSDGRRTEMLLERFAELLDACRRADVARAGQITETVDRLSDRFAPELTALAQAFIAEAQGRYRDAEGHASACLRQTHRSPELTRPIALVERATQRMRLGLLDAALNDLDEAGEYGPSLVSLQGVSIKALIHWWRGDQGQALDAVEQGPGFQISGVDLGVGWYALAAESVRNGQIYHEDLTLHPDCLALEFWAARSDQISGHYVTILGPHITRHEMAIGNDPMPLLAELDTGADARTATGQAYQWCVALANGDSRQLADIADGHRDGGAMLPAIQAYRDAAACADSDDSRERLLRRGRFLYDRLSRAVKASGTTDLPYAVARELTEAEQNVVSAVARGLTNKEAADLLNCSVRTIESHLTSAYKKLGVKRRTQLAVLIAHANVQDRL